MRINRKFIELTVLIILLVGISMAPTIAPQIAAPVNRVFAGFHEYSADYIQYVSYIKGGMYGRDRMYMRSYPFYQPPTPIHWMYSLVGMIASPFPVEAPVVYHLLRLVLGVIFILAVYRLYRLLFNSHNLAVITTVLAFTSEGITWFSHTVSGWQANMVSYFPFAVNVVERPVDRPHYILGSILFVAVCIALIQKRSSRLIVFLLFIGSFATLMVHVGSGIVLGGLAAVLAAFQVMQLPKNVFRNPEFLKVLSIGLGTAAAAFMTYIFTKIYSNTTNIFFDQYTYSIPFTFTSFLHQAISFGPLFWIGVPGLVIGLWTVRDNTWRMRFVMSTWIIIQFALFLDLYKILQVDNIRFVQSMYFIPLAYGTVWTFIQLAKRLGIRTLYVGFALICILSLPTYLLRLHDMFYEFTDYHSFSVFAFPTTYQHAAFTYLDRHTPVESIVMANYEAANLIIIYSHNRTLGNDQGWPHDKSEGMKRDVSAWFKGALPADQAKAYLTKYHVSYVYMGYQERTGIRPETYPFLIRVYQNPEVVIYRVAY